MSTPSPECARTNEHLLEYAYGELSGPPLAELEQHLPGCTRCQTDLASLRSTRKVMAGLQSEPAPDAGLESLLAYASQQAKRQQEPVRSRPKWLGWLLGAVPVAAAVVVVTSLVVQSHAPDIGPAAMNRGEAPGTPAPTQPAAPAVATAATPAPEEAKPQALPADAVAAAPAKAMEPPKPAAIEAERPATKKVAALGAAQDKYGHAGTDLAKDAKKPAVAQHATQSAEADDRVAQREQPARASPKPEPQRALKNEVSAPSGLASGAGERDQMAMAQAAPAAPPPPPAASAAPSETRGYKELASEKSEAKKKASVAMEEAKAERVAEAEAGPAPAAAAPTAQPRPSQAAGGAAYGMASDVAKGDLAGRSDDLDSVEADPAARADGLRRKGDHAAAADAYRAVYAANRGTSRGAEALFSAALEAQAAGQLARAAEDFERYAREFPRSSRAPTALARAAEIRRSSDGEGAATTLEQNLLSKYPNSPEAGGIRARSEERRRAPAPAKAKMAAPAHSFDDEPAPAAPAASETAK